MYRLLVFATFFVLSNAGLVRIPKVYNALISSDENLTPSHAYPIIEPVLRTTALGVAFPPIIVHPPLNAKDQPLPPIEDKDKEETTSTEKLEDDKKDKPKEIEKIPPEISYHGSLYPLAFDPYFSYAYNEFLFPALPFYQQPLLVDLTHYNGDKKEKQDLKPTVNFKKNPEIPDVPPPPLPIKDDKKEKA